MSELVYLPVEKLWPHPDNPRKVVDDLEELAASIRENGVLQNLTVVHVPEHTMDEGERRKVFEQTQENGVDSDEYKLAKELLDSGKVPEHYTVIIGHRRLAAAKMAGLESVPCVISEMTEKEQLQTMIMENMQRKDLKVYEEANAFQQLLDFGDTMEEVSQKSGFSVTTIKRRVKLTELNQTTLKEVVDTRQISLSDFDELAKIDDLKKRNEVLEKIGTRDFEFAVSSTIREQNIKKFLPAVKTAVKMLKAKKINESQTYGSDYDRICELRIADWDNEKSKIPTETSEPLFYVLDERWGELKLYKKHKRTRNVEKKSPEQLAREKKIRNKWKYINGKSQIFWELRKDFVNKLSVTNKNKVLVLHGALVGGLFGDICYNGSNRNEVVKILGYDDKFIDRDKRFIEAVSKAEQKDYAKLVWAMFNDDERNTVIRGYEGNEPKYDPAYKIIAVYEWLKTLGYKMSESEINLVYGKDPVYDESYEIPEENSESEPVHAGGAAEAENGEPGEV